MSRPMTHEEKTVLGNDISRLNEEELATVVNIIQEHKGSIEEEVRPLCVHGYEVPRLRLNRARTPTRSSLTFWPSMSLLFEH